MSCQVTPNPQAPNQGGEGLDICHEAILKMGRYGNASISGVDPEIVTRVYAFMVRLRRLQEAMIKEYHPADEMRCPVHFCVGQESVPAALSALVEPEDYVFSHHRNHGYYLAKGAPLNALLAEIYGRATGADGGLAGSQEVSYADAKFFSGAILASSIGIAVGAARALKLQKKPQVAVAAFGDGAADQGILWESLNFAALNKLPVIFLCENNGYSTYSPQRKRQVRDNITERAACFGVKARSLFGNDVMGVYRAIGEAMIRARRGEGPTLLQAYTYRWYAHVGPEDDDYVGYRSPEEVACWKSNCPIGLLEEQMVAGGLLNPERKDTLIRNIDREIEDAFAFAKSSPYPDVQEWAPLNYSQTSPLADRLLRDIEACDFDQNQAECIPGPY